LASGRLRLALRQRHVHSRQTVFDFSRSDFILMTDHEITNLVHDVRHSCRLGRLNRKRADTEHGDHESTWYNFDRDRQHRARYNCAWRGHDLDWHGHDDSRKESGQSQVATEHPTATTHSPRPE